MKTEKFGSILDWQLAPFALLGLDIIFEFENYEECFLKP